MLRVGSFAGAPIYVASSWFLIAGLIAVVVAPRVEQVQPGLGAWRFVAGFAFAVILYLSVLLHEASHAAVAQRLGYPVTSITLNFLGGLTAIEGESRRPRHEFWIAVVGPLTSIAVGLGAVALWFVTPEGLLRMAVEGLAGANLVVGALNLVPGLPLDGGRVLRAGVWAATGNQHTGTTAAGWGGRLAALLVLAWPLLQQVLFDIEPTFLDFVMVAVIGMFLWTGATAAMTGARLRARLPALVARELARPALAVPEDLSIAEAVRRAQEAHAGSIITVASSGVPTGIVNESAVLATPEERRPWVAVSSVARRTDDTLVLPVDLSGEPLIRAMSANPAEEYLLVGPEGRIFGVLATADVDRAFRAERH
jgi:Zn-dependent protease